MYMYSFNNALYRSHELPPHEKICLRGLRSGRRHKTGCTAQEITEYLNVLLRRELVPLIWHLNNKRIKTAIYIECKVFKRTETFHGSCSILPPCQYSRGTKVGDMLTLAPERYTAGLCMVTKIFP